MRLLLLLLTSYVAMANARPMRHVFILQSSADMVFGNYMFVSQANQDLDFVVPLPLEQSDFRPEPGIDAAELVLDGSLRLRKKTTKEEILGISFKAPASLGRALLNFDGAVPGEEWQILIPIGSMNLKGSDWEKGKPQRLGGQIFDAYQRVIQQDPKVRVELTGVVEGRTRFWYLGTAFGLLLLITMGGVLWRQRGHHVA